MKVAVVGAGIVGASAARVLASRGHRVFLYDARPAGHSLGSSHGNSRIVRKAYPDPFYTRCMSEAYPLWRELEEAASISVLHECGLAYFGSRDSERLQSIARGLADLRVNHSVLTAAEAGVAVPGLRLESAEVAILTPEAGWADASAALEATIGLAISAGAELRRESAPTVHSLEQEFDSFGLAVGPWIGDWIPVPVRVSLQTYGYVQASRPDGPVWIEDGDDGMYGFPSEPRVAGFKVGVHRLGRAIDPREPDRTPSSEHVSRIAALATERFGIEAPRIDSVAGCLYTSTATEDFLVGRMGSSGFFVSACSGHGFKFGPWNGRMLANFVEGSDEPEGHPRFYWESGINSAAVIPRTGSNS